MADFARLESLFFRALAKTEAEERKRFLENECGQDAALREQVERLLAGQVAAGSFLEKPAASPEATKAYAAVSENEASKESELLGTQVGPYKLLQKLGEGGMGTVWVAEQEQPVKRRVALKLVKAGMDSAQVIRRFEAERQALALMDHTNIAKVLDAGTTSQGRPYFVMELVKGVPITKYCDEVHASIQNRLELFIQVCSAVQHAHQKGIIHRDIKPSNVLIAMQDGKPVPKVIDFGVAKALHSKLADQTMYTEIGQIIGTLEYMAPEQAELSAMDIDTRADIYALGVLLYELLTGSTPITRERMKSAAFAEVIRLIKEEDPPKPSTRLTQSKESLASLAALRKTDPKHLSAELKGELDWVVLKALEKDRTCRYESANGLARDIQRYLADEVVEARPPSTGYQLRKFVRRHKGQVIAASLVLLALLAGIIATSAAMFDAQRQRQLAVAAEQATAERAEGERLAKQKAVEEARKASKQAEIAEAVKLFLERDLIAQANPLDFGENNHKPDADLKLKTALDRAVPRIAKRFEGKPLIEASIRRAIGKAYEGRGIYGDAQVQMERACELYRAEIAHANPSELETLVLEPYIESLLDLVNLYSTLGQKQKALATISTLEDQVRRSLGDNPEGKAILEPLSLLREINEGKDAKLAFKKSQEILQKLFGEKSSEFSYDQKDVEDLAKTAFKSMEKYLDAKKLMDQGKYPEAELALRQLIDAQPDKEGGLVMPFIATLAEVYRLQGKNAEAKAKLIIARDGIRKALGEDHLSMAGCRHSLALILLSEKNYAQAETEIRAMQPVYEKLFPNTPATVEVKNMLGIALLGQKKYADAEPLLLAGYEGLKQQKSSPEIRKTLLPEALDRLIQFYTETNKPDEVKKWQAERDKYPKTPEKK